MKAGKVILQAAFIVYGNEGYLTTTMDKIAARADLSKTTLGIMNRAG